MAIIEIGSHYAKFELEHATDNKLKGKWIRTNKDDYIVSLTGDKTNLKLYSKKYEQKSSALNLSGRWKIKLNDEGKYGLGNFTQKGSRVKGTILTTTGDYRFLDGAIEKNTLTLYGFDGVFSFVFKVVVQADQFTGMMYSGNSYNTKISAVRDELFELESATAMTKSTAKKMDKFDYVDISGEKVNFDSEEYKGKAKVIQLFGSWCPNCIDETNFFTKWMKQNPAKLNHVKFIALSFENTKTKKEAIKNLVKVKRKLAMNYPLVLIDFDKSVKATEIIPLDKVRSFPTTIFLNRENEIIKIHTSFAGQATGEFFLNFVFDFNETITNMIKE